MQTCVRLPANGYFENRRFDTISAVLLVHTHKRTVGPQVLQLTHYPLCAAAVSEHGCCSTPELFRLTALAIPTRNAR